MLANNKSIAIVGGGPGGLILARLLQMNGANVKVYERDVNKDARVQGATLDLHEESGLKALQAAGLMDAFKASYRPGADKCRIVDNNAIIFYDQHIIEKAAYDFGHEYFRPEIDRGPLRKILLGSLQPGTVVWDSQFMQMEKAGEGWKLTFQNGNTALADIVIGADGANSKIRPFVTSIKPFYAGVTAVEGNVYDAETAVPAIFKLLKNGKIFAFGDDKTLIVSGKGDGSLGFYLGFKTDENWSKNSGINFKDNEQVLAWFKRDFKEWDSTWYELFQSEKISFVPRPQYCMPLNQTWDALPSITLLGDAAHLMPPYAGEGVNMAMLDALELSKCLIDGGYADTQTAIATYEKHMRERAALAAKMTLENTEWMHGENAMATMVGMFTGH